MRVCSCVRVYVYMRVRVEQACVIDDEVERRKGCLMRWLEVVERVDERVVNWKWGAEGDADVQVFGERLTSLVAHDGYVVQQQISLAQKCLEDIAKPWGG